MKNKDRYLTDLDSWSPAVFLMPSILVVLFVSIFPLIGSLYMAFSRFKFVKGGIEFKYIGILNFKKLLIGSQQYHFLGTFKELSLFSWVVIVLLTLLVLYRLIKYFISDQNTIIGLIGWTAASVIFLSLSLIILKSLGSGGRLGTLGVTMFYVFFGTVIQYTIGLGLALLCVQNLKGKIFFRSLFFIPLMITPVGTGYLFRMLTDTTNGPFKPIWVWLGYQNYSWASNAWGARIAVVIADSWIWIPFMLIVLISAIESQDQSLKEAALIDGASSMQLFRYITWPGILPTSIVIIFIRVIDGFKIVDLPSVLTSGGPGIASESMTLHSFFTWRSLDLGGSSAISYLLLFVVIFFSLSIINGLRRYTVTDV